MFTGIIEEIGSVVDIDHGRDSAVLTFRGPLVAADTPIGGSIAVNGVCLTVVKKAGDDVSADVMAETLARSSLGSLAPGDPVNLERAMRLDGRLDGHLVQGHVDDTGTILTRTPGDRWEVVRISLPEPLARFVALKGAIAVDGTSLTVSGVGDDWFEVALIPATLEHTVLGRKQPGETVNLEADVMAKYAARLLEGN